MGGTAWPEEALAQLQPWADLPSRKYKRQEVATPTPASGGRRSAEPPSRRAKPETKPPPWGLRVLGRGRKPQDRRAGNQSAALPHRHLTAVSASARPRPAERWLPSAPSPGTPRCPRSAPTAPPGGAQALAGNSPTRCPQHF